MIIVNELVLENDIFCKALLRILRPFFYYIPLVKIFSSCKDFVGRVWHTEALLGVDAPFKMKMEFSQCP